MNLRGEEGTTPHEPKPIHLNPSTAKKVKVHNDDAPDHELGQTFSGRCGSRRHIEVSEDAGKTLFARREREAGDRKRSPPIPIWVIRSRLGKWDRKKGAEEDVGAERYVVSVTNRVRE
ncbi:hypothetical protein NPIL_58701 [Nephila pilipes]|uniref:Uncharacterized protein n=1 Tax=Nephila pilipes TaxID=299642 RepID=A0A8X6U3P9_NEPPI|nr:hypothetical protein NPIL_58701 [Nephila pilipes]